MTDWIKQQFQHQYQKHKNSQLFHQTEFELLFLILNEKLRTSLPANTLQELNLEMFQEVSNVINKSLKENVDENALINEIHPEIDIKLNSVNIIVGKQGSGKTVAALEEIIKMSLLGIHHLLIYVTKDGNESDKTWLALKHLIKIPYLIISENEIEEYIKKLLSAKNLYNVILRDDLVNKITDEQRDHLLEFLCIDDFEKDTLHTLLLFDDISNSILFKESTSYFSQLLRRLRHVNISVFLIVQGWGAIKSHIKNEITTLFIFPSFNNRQIQYIYSQSASNLSNNEFYDMYSYICNIKNKFPNKHPYIVVQVTGGGETYVNLHHHS